MKRLLVAVALLLPSAAYAQPCEGTECPAPALRDVSNAVASARSLPAFGFDTFESILREVYGKDAKLSDRARVGVPGHVDVGDRFEYVKNGRKVVTRLGKDRYEQALLNAHIVKAARDLDAAGVSFSGRSADDRVNKKLWWMGYGGKMGVRQGVKSSDAVRDVFENGDAYAFECATGNLLVYYKAILDRIGPEDFDEKFPKLRLFRWELKDDDLKKAEKQGKVDKLWPGDHVYFDNPDFDPANSAWQGENTIYLGNDEYFGHGLGIHTKREVIDSLNSLRKPGARRSAKPDLGHVLRLKGGVIGALDASPN